MRGRPAKSDDWEPQPGQGGYRSTVRKARSVLPFCIVILLAACGARLTNDERLAGVRALQGGGGSGTGASTGTGTAGTGFTTGTGTGGTGGSLGPNGAPLPGAIGSAPPGGNGGATDTGVTGTELTIAIASDVTGVQAGLFKSTWQAMNGLAAMVNSQGGLYGRRLKVLYLDTKADATANQAAVRSACDRAFALVGSMSAFDNGGAEVGEKCGIPDVSAIPVNGARSLANNVYAANPIRPDKFAIGTGNYIKSKYGSDVIRNAAMLYLNAGVTKANALQRRRAYESVGFDFSKYFQQVEVLEPNYNSFVQTMKDKGIRYVNMVANYQSIQKLLKAMDQVEWHPTVMDWDSVAYSQNFLTVGPAANNSLVFLNTAIYEELSSNPEMQLYNTWLNRVAPGAKPDFFGFYAWSAGRLFLKVHEMVGPKITRKAFFSKIKTIHSWDGYGLHAAHDIGNKLQSPCFMYLQIVNEKFVRKDPAGRGMICNQGGIINT
jgi:ABC-type branched-subunit amino acid transport system substrate-binding protein